MSLFRDLFRKHDSPKNPALERAMHEMARNDNAKTRESRFGQVSRNGILGNWEWAHNAP
jgi:hypothetical protein